MANEALNPIYDRLTQAPTYHPLSANTFADWSMEAGDLITVSRDGQSYQAPVHSSTMTWRGKQQIEVNATGNKERESIAKVSAKKYNGRGGGGIRNNQAIYWEMFSDDGHLAHSIEATESVLRSTIRDTEQGLTSVIEQTASHIHMYVDNSYDQLRAGLFLTASTAQLYVDDRYHQMQTGLLLTASQARLYVDDKYNQMQTGLMLTSSSAWMYVDSKYNQMQSGLALTASSAKLYVDNRYSQMQSGLSLTASSARLYVDSKYSQLQSGLQLTASSTWLYVDSKYSQMQSGLSMTSSSIRLYVDDTKEGLQSNINQTASSIRLSVSQVDQRVGTIEGSQIWQTRDNITNIVGSYKWEYDYSKPYYDSTTGQWTYEKKITLKNGASLNITKNGITSEVVTNGTVVSAINQSSEGVSIAGNKINIGGVVQGINASEVTISADKVNLDGYVTAKELQTTNASIDNLKNGNTIATYINAQSLGASNSFTFKGSTIVWQNATVVTGISVSAEKHYFIAGELKDGSVVNGKRYLGYTLIGYSSKTIYFLGANE